jgi:hypothetical protein
MMSILILLLNACASAKKSPDFKSHDLVGVWELKFDGVYPYWFSQIGFTQDGKKCVLSYEFDSNGKVRITYYSNRYEIKDGHLFSTVGFSSTPYVRSGEVIKDRVDKITSDYFEVFMISPFIGDTPEKHQRLPGLNPEDICKIVDDFRISH